MTVLKNAEAQLWVAFLEPVCKLYVRVSGCLSSGVMYAHINAADTCTDEDHIIVIDVLLCSHVVLSGVQSLR